MRRREGEMARDIGANAGRTKKGRQKERVRSRQPASELAGIEIAGPAGEWAGGSQPRLWRWEGTAEGGGEVREGERDTPKGQNYVNADTR